MTPIHHPFELDEAVALLVRTPAALSSLLDGLPDVLIRATEGPDTWSPYDVIGHLIHGELTDWIPRARHIIEGRDWPFDAFDRTAQFATSSERTSVELLEEFARLRRESIATLEQFHISEADLERTGIHPELGVVTLGQLLATWVVHDLNHVSQIARTMAKRHTSNVGPWSAYLSILRDRT